MSRKELVDKIMDLDPTKDREELGRLSREHLEDVLLALAEEGFLSFSD